MTLTDEGTLDAGVFKRRQQKIYGDVLGRTVKTEVLNWQGGSVYAATVNTYNTRDQITQIRQYAGAEGSGTYQDTMMTYDGHGRLKTRKLPEQNVGTATVWDYNADDTIQKITDSRGASQTFSYNNRHLITGITYSAPGGITPTPSVTFAYDAAGNRTSMTDGLGSVSYQYDTLSRMTSETRTFSSLGSYTLSYEYNLAGGLKSLTDHTNQRINYGYDSIGRLTNLTGTNYNINQFINSVTYRAWGASKQIAYGNGRTASINYNSRLQISHFEIPSGGGSGSLMSIDYQYHSDGRLRYSRDLLEPRFDRLYEYDHASRITTALSGAEARGEPSTTDRPYQQVSAYDTFDHLTARLTRHWSKTQPYFVSDSYTNNRRDGWQYDAAGNLTSNLTNQYTYDAAGRMTAVSGASLNQFFDGDGKRVKTTQLIFATYYLRSTVLRGKVIAELDSSGARQLGFIYVGDELIAEQFHNGSVGFVHKDASGLSIRKTHSQFGNTYALNELDPQGADVELEDPYPANPDYSGRGQEGPLYPGYGNITQPGNCTWDGVWVPCDMAYRALGSGAAVLAPERTTRYNYDKQSFEFFRAYADGRYGWVLAGAIYLGHGYFEAPGGWDNEDDLLEEDRLDPQDPVPQPRPTPTPTPQTNCGVNPVTGQPGFTRNPINQTGHLRDDGRARGHGHFRASRGRGTRQHDGLDITGDLNQSAAGAFLAGRVSFIGNLRGYGNVVFVHHGNNLESRYAHLQNGSINAAGITQVGQNVTQGQQIGTVGNTGNARNSTPHLHFEIRRNGVPVDPEAFLNQPCPP